MRGTQKGTIGPPQGWANINVNVCAETNAQEDGTTSSPTIIEHRARGFHHQ